MLTNSNDSKHIGIESGPKALPTPFPQSAHNDTRQDELPDFVCISASLRRLLLQAEVTGNRMQIATIDGEAGVGKHLFAQTIHQRSALASLPFRRFDAREWLATDTEPDHLTGTLYLDRVDLLESAGQNLLLNLLRTLPDGTISRLAHFRLLVSSHIPIRHLAAQGKFLPDLAFRLSAVRFYLPPLREHREDIAPITQALIERICRRYQQPVAALAQGTLPRLLQHTWPGNVRELAATLESAILESETGVIRPSDLQLDQLPIDSETSPTTLIEKLPSPGLTDDLSLDAAILRHIQSVLDLHRGNKLRAAKQLGISRSTLYRLLAGESSIES